MERDLPEAPDTVPLQPPGLLHAFEHTLNGLALGIEVLPLLAAAPDHPEESYILGRVLPDLAVTVPDPAPHGPGQVTTLAAVQVALLRVAADVLHRDLAQARRDALLGVYALVETVVGLAAPDMNDRDDALPMQLLVVRRRVISTVGNHGGGLEPGVQGLRPGYHRRQLRRVVPLRSRDKVGQGHSVVCVGHHVDLVAVVPLLAACLGPAEFFAVQDASGSLMRFRLGLQWLLTVVASTATCLPRPGISALSWWVRSANVASTRSAW